MNQPDFNIIVQYLLGFYNQMELQDKTGVHQHVISQLNTGKPKPRISYAYGSALVKEYIDKKGDKDAANITD